jgi:ABC-type antimicrobial peptide transport system permease subunit
MNINIRRCLFGGIYGLLISLIFSFIISNVSGILFGGTTFEHSLWLFWTSCIPFTISFAVSGYFLTYRGLQ